MTMACARFGCTERAHTVLVFEPGSAAAWLMHAVDSHRTQGILLCRAHADVVTVPVGWNLVDERDPTWEPVRSAAPQTPEPEPTEAAKAQPTAPFREADVVDIASAAGAPADAEQEEPAAEVAADEEAAFEEVVAAQWTDAPDSDDEAGTPTLFAVDDEAEADDSAENDPGEDDHDGASDNDQTGVEAAQPDTPLLNRAFRAAERI